MSDSSKKSEKESVQEDESDLGDDDLRAERRLDIAPAFATGGSVFPPDDVIRRAHPFPFDIPLYMSAETRRQHETMNQNETTNHDDERKMPAIPVREEEDTEALSQATTLTKNSVAGAIPPTDMADVEIATSVPVVCRATRSLGLIVTDVDGGRVDDDTVDRILSEDEDENDDSYASCSVYHPELNQDDDEECPAFL
jgi:hypothetical protein